MKITLLITAIIFSCSVAMAGTIGEIRIYNASIKYEAFYYIKSQDGKVQTKTISLGYDGYTIPVSELAAFNLKPIAIYQAGKICELYDAEGNKRSSNFFKYAVTNRFERYTCFPDESEISSVRCLCNGPFSS